MARTSARIIIGVGGAGLAAFLALGAGMTPPSAAARRGVPAILRTAPAAASRPAALDGLRAGLWTVKVEGAMPQRLCIGDPGMLVQVQHRDAACSRLVIAAGRRDATVHYSCPGVGWGRTSLRLDDADTVRIDTQGIADNAPFAYRAEARREGDCRVAVR